MSLPVIPAPAQYVATDSTFSITATTGVDIQSPELAHLAPLFTEDVHQDTGLLLTGSSGITVALSSAATAIAPVAGVRADGLAVDERHTIDISQEGVHITGATPEGVHRALTTLRQLISANLQDDRAVLPTGTITDGPRFAWRGLSLDVVRTFHAPPEVRRIIDMLALYKFNVLHLHLTDDQGWRVEVPSRPALTDVAAKGAIDDRPGGYYTKSELAELVAYAADRFVTVVPEIDMPGHTTAVFTAYPELAPAQIRTVDLGNGASMQLSTLQPDLDETWSFVEDVLDAIIPQFPQSAFVHIGGDEAWGMSDEDHAAFVDRAAALVRARGKQVIGWQEIARAAIDPGDVVQYWMDIDLESMDAGSAPSDLPDDLLPILVEGLQKAQHDVPKALAAGARILASPTTWLYFDRPHKDATSDPAQEEARARLGLQFYGPASIQHGISWDPVESLRGVESVDQVIGVEAAIWCESIVTTEDLELMLLPRLPGAAEKGWSHETVTDWPTYAERLGRQSRAWRNRTWTWLKSTEVDWN
jgi:hexosaminidase